MRRGRLAVRSAALAIVVTASACGGSSKPKATTATTQAQPKQGGTVTFGSYIPIPGLDPATWAGSGVGGGTEAVAIFGYLMRYDLPTQSFVPAMAQSL
jgi:peptide/nickel transport system substrate-binding protein